MENRTKSVEEPSALDPVYATRDDLAAHFKPVNAFERMLLASAAQSWLRYQDALKLERRFFEKNDPLDVLTKQPKTFNTITRHVATCERAWRRALEEIRRAIRNREKTLASPNARRAADRPAAPPPPIAKPATAVLAAPTTARRE